eukprot:TRINITY_DN782_c0_g1_i1.p1 TRINITY_DN782_c0_g1~~TRINITY_DN782_c0_g1_i1.p1  ORF type:complete len:240 (+),score=65.94 TRINITY_DN782_c0_g1_i1:156-875(+)
MISVLSLAENTHAHTGGVLTSCPEKDCPSCWSHTVFWTVLVVGAAYYYVSLSNKNRVAVKEHSPPSSSSSILKHDKAVTAQPTSVSTSTSTISPTLQNTATNTNSSELDNEPSSPVKPSTDDSDSTSPSTTTSSYPSDDKIELSRVNAVIQGLNQLNADKKRTISDLSEQLSSSQALRKEAMTLYEQEAKLRLQSESQLKSIMLQAQGLLSGPLADETADSVSNLQIALEFLREIATKN